MGTIVESKEVEPGVILDYDDQGRVVGVELLRIRDRAAGASLRNDNVREYAHIE